MTGSISMRHSDRAANDIHEGGIVQSAPLSLQHTAVHNNYDIQIFENTFHQYCTRHYLNNYDIISSLVGVVLIAGYLTYVWCN